MEDEPEEEDSNGNIMGNGNNVKIVEEPSFRLIEENDFPEEKPMEEEIIEYAYLNPRDVSVNKAIEQLNMRSSIKFEQERTSKGVLEE